MNITEFKNKIQDAADRISTINKWDRYGAVCDSLNNAKLSGNIFHDAFSPDEEREEIYDYWLGKRDEDHVGLRLTFLAFYQVYMIEEGLL